MDVVGNWYPEGTYGAMQPMDRVCLTGFGSAVARFIRDPAA